MKPLPLEEVATILGGSLNTATPQHRHTGVSGFATDSREAKPGDLFLAIKGENVDGHDYAAQALSQGAAAALVERPIDGPHILVDNLVQALARMALHFREQFKGPVIGITGSAGKTTTKELLAAALSPLGKVLKTEGNRNTEYTAPLLWAELEPDTKAVVVEMAMRGFGQIAHLAAFSRPTIGVVTNIGYSHLLQVGDRQGIARAKGELLQSLPREGGAILWQGDAYLDVLKPMTRAFVLTFGYTEGSKCRITSYEPIDWTRSRVRGEIDEQPWEAELPAAGQHIALNAAAAVLTAWAVGVPAPEAALALRQAKLPPMRMEILHLNGATIVLDAYNAAPPSMLAAIETLGELPCEGRRMAVIGEMRELGDHTEEAHAMVGRALAEHGVEEVALVGEPTEHIRRAAMEAGMGEEAIRMADGLGDVTRFLQTATRGDTVLIKGSRALELERALQPLLAVPK